MRTAALLVLAGILAEAARAAESDPWWERQWSARRFISVQPTGAAVAGSETGWVEFRGMGRQAKDGQDLRITADGKPVPCKVLYSGPDDRIVAAFKMPREARRYFAYFGNPAAPKLPGQWSPERGLWLEVRHLNPGPMENWEQMQALLAKAGRSLGAGPVRNVFQGWNPFSSHERFVASYQGFLNVAAEGEYTFCLSSKDASFLRIDDRPIVDFPGLHPPLGHARRTGKATLSRGVHRFEFAWAVTGPPCIAAAYWQPPEKEALSIIPPEAFTPVAAGAAGALEVLGGPALDVEAKGAGLAYVGDRPLLRYSLQVVSPPGAKEVSWDFGDGQTAQGARTAHLYLRAGIFKVGVQAVVDGKPVQGGTFVQVEPDQQRLAEGRLDKEKEFFEELRSTRLEALDTASLEAAASIVFLLQDVDAQIAAARALLSRPGVSEAVCFDQALRLQELLRDKKKDADGALKVLALAEERFKNDKNRRARLLREIGDVYYYYQQDLDKALLQYDAVVGRYFGLEDDIVRVTKIRIGDIQRERGNYEKAAANYTEAERLRTVKVDEAQAPVRLGVIIHAAEDFLRRKEPVEARKWVEVMEWEFPLERLRGQSSLLRAKIALLEKNTLEARKQLEALARVNPDSQYIGEALLLLAEVYQGEGKPDRAQTLLKELVEKHPDSESVPEAEKRLKALEAPAPSTRPPPKKKAN